MRSIPIRTKARTGRPTATPTVTEARVARRFCSQGDQNAGLTISPHGTATTEAAQSATGFRTGRVPRATAGGARSSTVVSGDAIASSRSAAPSWQRSAPVAGRAARSTRAPPTRRPFRLPASSIHTVPLSSRTDARVASGHRGVHEGEVALGSAAERHRVVAEHGLAHDDTVDQQSDRDHGAGLESRTCSSRARLRERKLARPTPRPWSARYTASRGRETLVAVSAK